MNWGRVARSFEEHMIFSTFGLVENWVTNKFVGVFPSKGTTCWGKLRYPILDEKPFNYRKNTWFYHQKPLFFSDEAMFLWFLKKMEGNSKIPTFHFDTKMY